MVNFFLITRYWKNMLLAGKSRPFQFNLELFDVLYLVCSVTIVGVLEKPQLTGYCAVNLIPISHTTRPQDNRLHSATDDYTNGIMTLAFIFQCKLIFSLDILLCNRTRVYCLNDLVKFAESIAVNQLK